MSQRLFSLEIGSLGAFKSCAFAIVEALQCRGVKSYNTDSCFCHQNCNFRNRPLKEFTMTNVLLTSYFQVSSKCLRIIFKYDCISPMLRWEKVKVRLKFLYFGIHHLSLVLNIS